MILVWYLIPDIVSPGSGKVLDKIHKIVKKILISKAVTSSCQSSITMFKICSIPKRMTVHCPDNFHVQLVSPTRICQLLLSITGQLIIIKHQGKASLRHLLESIITNGTLFRSTTVVKPLSRDAGGKRDFRSGFMHLVHGRRNENSAHQNTHNSNSHGDHDYRVASIAK